MIMDMAVMNFIPRCRRMLGDSTILNRVLVFSTIYGLFEGVSIFALLPAITSLVTGQPVLGLGVTGWIVVLAGLAVLGGVANYFQLSRGYSVAMFFIRVAHDMIGNRVATLPLGWFNKPLAGKLSRMVSTELMMAGEIIAHFVSPFISNLVVSLVVLVLTYTWDVRLGITLTVATPFFLLFVALSTKLNKKAKDISEPAEVELSNRIVEFAHCQAALRSCGRSANYSELTTANQEWLRAKRKELWLNLAGNVVGNSFSQSIVVTLVFMSAQFAVGGTLQPVEAIAFIGLCLRYTQVLTGITDTTAALEDRRPVLDAIDEVVTATPLPEPDTATPEPTPGTISLDHVAFSYEDGTPVLRDITFAVPAKTMVALVGPSGCGKTTIARLISRFYDVTAGSVKVGGVDVREQTTKQLMANLSMVFQDVYLFDDTLEANIRIGREDATMAELHEAARLAGVTEIVDRLPRGWDTPVGEGGRALSGGERQRVAIARALLKQAPIVLLDEATSALDPENEENVVVAVDKLRETATILVIAHKLDTIRKADAIVQLRADGTVEDIGTHEELFARGGTYRSFWDHRAAAQGWQL